jgi:heme/copper-type cytochrome/quinol oxidase subunit 1
LEDAFSEEAFIILIWLQSVNHKSIGTLYLIMGAWAGVLGVGVRLMVRVELGGYGVFLGSGQIYNRLITVHALLIIFFMIIPILIGTFANWFLPLMLGSVDLIFPRMNNLRVWLLLPALFILITSVFTMDGRGVGWTLYPPLSSFFHSSSSVDRVIFSLHLAGISSIISSINFIVSIFGFRSRLINLGRMSLFVWRV